MLRSAVRMRPGRRPRRKGMATLVDFDGIDKPIRLPECFGVLCHKLLAVCVFCALGIRHPVCLWLVVTAEVRIDDLAHSACQPREHSSLKSPSPVGAIMKTHNRLRVEIRLHIATAMPLGHVPHRQAPRCWIWVAKSDVARHKTTRPVPYLNCLVVKQGCVDAALRLVEVCAVRIRSRCRHATAIAGSPIRIQVINCGQEERGQTRLTCSS